MANIMINEVCNLQCPYCFANKHVNGDTSTDITYKNFKEAVDWINGSAVPGGPAPRVALIGGEPTIHPQFEDLINYACEVRLPNQEILVFTNAYKIDKYVDLLATKGVSLLINLNSYEDIGEKRYKQTVENIRELRLKGVSTSIGINFYKGDLDTKFVLDVIEEFRFRDLRVGVACPNTKLKIEAGAFEYFEEIKEPIIKLMEDCAKRSCVVHFDCQKIPHCIMKDSIERIENIPGMDPGRVLEHAVCHPVIDILTDLQLVRCFGVSDRKFAMPMKAFANERDAEKYFATNIDNIGLMVPYAERCNNCYYRNIGQCQGGCINFKMDRIEQIVKPVREELVR